MNMKCPKSKEFFCFTPRGVLRDGDLCRGGETADHLLMPPGDKKTNRDLARSTTLSSTLVETKTICSQNEDNWTSAAVRRAVALRSRTPGGLSSHQRGASSSSARQRAGISHAGGRPAWSGPPVRPRQSFQAALRAGTSVASTRGERLEGC